MVAVRWVKGSQHFPVIVTRWASAGPGQFCPLWNSNDFNVVDCRVLMRTPHGRATSIEIEIAIEIGKLPEIDFDHDFDTELLRFENNNALGQDESVKDLVVAHTGSSRRISFKHLEFLPLASERNSVCQRSVIFIVFVVLINFSHLIYISYCLKLIVRDLIEVGCFWPSIQP